MDMNQNTGHNHITTTTVEGILLPDIIVKEWDTQLQFISLVPEKAQKGFQTIDLQLTAIGVLTDYIALGTNVGILYWYNRQQHHLDRLKFMGNNCLSTICSIAVASCENYMIAAGSKEGLVAIFQIPKLSAVDETGLFQQENGIQQRRKIHTYSVRDIHRGSITSLNWSPNGMKLFCGDSYGIISETQIDFSSDICQSSSLLTENSQIVQLSYTHQRLLISTLQRTILYYTKSKEIIQVGNQERKVHGHYGCVFESGLWSKAQKLYAARPGLRLWEADQEGNVQNTFIFKDLIRKSHANITLFNPIVIPYSSVELQFGKLLNFNGNYLVTSSLNNLYILDPKKVGIIGSCQFKSILDMDTCQNEIFILENSRSIRRLSTLPDIQPKSTSTNTLTSTSEFKSPEQTFKIFASKLKETSFTLPKFNSSSLIATMRNVLEVDLNIQDGQFPLPLVIPLPRSPDTPQLIIQESSPIITPQRQQSNQNKIIKFQKISDESFQDVLHSQFKPNRKGKKRDYMSDSISLSSQGSGNSHVEPISDSPPKHKLPLSIGLQDVVTDDDIQSKEQTLAKMLNWDQLLSGTHTTQNDDDSRLEHNHINHSLNSVHDYPLEYNGHETHYDIPSELSEKIELLQTNSSNSIAVVENEMILDVSIFDRNDSKESGDFFGPPSGSSHLIVSGPPSLATEEPYATTEESPQSIPLMVNGIDQDVTVTGVELNENWIYYELPFSVSSLSISDKYIFCTDDGNAVYYSTRPIEAEDNTSLCWIKTNFQAKQIIQSPNGFTIWRIDLSNKLSQFIPNESSANSLFGYGCRWEFIFDNVKVACLGVHTGFILETNFKLYGCILVKGNLTFQDIVTPTSFKTIQTLNDSVWAGSVDGRIWYKQKITQHEDSFIQNYWQELRLGNTIPISYITIGPCHSIWLADNKGQLQFLNKLRIGKFNLWDVCVSSELLESSDDCNIPSERQNVLLNQLTQKVSDSLKWVTSNKSTSSSSGNKTILSTSYSGILFTITGNSSLYLNKISAHGHHWRRIELNSFTGIKNCKWNNIYGGSIYKGHGFLWLEDSKGNVFYLESEKSYVHPIDLPCGNLKCISTAPEAFWILADGGRIYARCNINVSDELGNGWDLIDVSSLPEQHKLVHVSCGSEVVWGVDDIGNIYVRKGSLNPPSPTDISPPWIPVEGNTNCNFQPVFTHVYVSPNDRIVWAIDSLGNAYAREAVFPDFPIGIGWVLIPSVEVHHMAISDSAVWICSKRGEIFRRCGITHLNFVGDFWKRIPGSSKIVTVSVCDEVWGLDGLSRLMKHSEETVDFCQSIDKDEEEFQEAEDNDGEWEFV